jgi:hypothetical protein
MTSAFLQHSMKIALTNKAIGAFNFAFCLRPEHTKACVNMVASPPGELALAGNPSAGA